MIFNAENILLIGSILLFVSIVVSKTGYRFGIPTLLVFLLVSSVGFASAVAGIIHAVSRSISTSIRMGVVLFIVHVLLVRRGVSSVWKLSAFS